MNHAWRSTLTVSLTMALAGCQLFNFRDRIGPTPTVSGSGPVVALDPMQLAMARKRYHNSFSSFDTGIRIDPQFSGFVLTPVSLAPKSGTDAQPIAAQSQSGTLPSDRAADSGASADGKSVDNAVEPESPGPAKPVEEDLSLASAAPSLTPQDGIRDQHSIEFCKKIDRRLSSVTFRNCLLEVLHDSKFRTRENNPIFYVNFESEPKKNPLGRVLVLGGVHGDELTSVSIVYLWIKTLNRFHSGLFDWRVVPVVNPDGLFSDTPTRTNANGIDLNRNLPTYQWNQLSARYWKKQAGAAERKFPGHHAASEPETRWLINEINDYKPDVIVTVHAPYNLVDFDAADRTSAPRQLGILRGKSLGTFPGSLGRYAGEERNIPVITLELPHSTRMPSKGAINGIWLDLVGWLRQNINTQNIAGRSFNHCTQSHSAGCI